MSDDKLTDFLAVGSITGILSFLNGLRIFARYRALARAAEAPIDGISHGLVGICGKASPVGNLLANSPVRRTPCLFYRVDIEKEVRPTLYTRQWSPFKSTAGGMSFYIDDGTGKVLVNPFGADCDLLPNCTREVPPSTSSPSAADSISDAELIAYAASAQGNAVAGVDATDKIPILGFSTGRYRFSEYCILPDREYSVVGTCVENPQPKDAHDRNMIVQGDKNRLLRISWQSKTEEEDDIRGSALTYIWGGAAVAVICLCLLIFFA